uniref:Uncharacterized protein n=1 Tax=Arion vulgaris TaxID=1028688 RepID=A0A0B7AAX1_9EUPU
MLAEVLQMRSKQLQTCSMCNDDGLTEWGSRRNNIKGQCCARVSELALTKTLHHFLMVNLETDRLQMGGDRGIATLV